MIATVRVCPATAVYVIDALSALANVTCRVPAGIAFTRRVSKATPKNRGPFTSKSWPLHVPVVPVAAPAIVHVETYHFGLPLVS